nr:RNA methyltransferase [Saprospiraceae bacterium]
MISKQKISLLNSLAKKKFRDQHQRYLLEGVKIVQTVLKANPETVEDIFLLPEWVETFQSHISKCTTIDSKVLKKISNHKNPGGVVAVAKIHPPELMESKSHVKLSVFLDGVQDPGNVGTIIRSCDWYGIECLFLGDGCADLYNSKVIQATMGSHVGIDIFSMDFEEVLDFLKPEIIIGADMEGSTSYKPIEKSTLLCIGSEGQGLSPRIRKACDSFLTVKGRVDKLAESLNAGIVTAILLDRFNAL